MITRKLIFTASLIIGVGMTNVNTEAAVPFAKRSQRLLYGATSTEYDLEVKKDGVSVKYKFSGANAIAQQNYCGFWLSVCDDSGDWLKITPLSDNLNP